MVDHGDSGRCATWFAGLEKTLESAETIPTAQEMPISHLASFISATPDDARTGMNACAFLAFPQDPRRRRHTAARAAVFALALAGLTMSAIPLAKAGDLEPPVYGSPPVYGPYPNGGAAYERAPCPCRIVLERR